MSSKSELIQALMAEMESMVVSEKDSTIEPINEVVSTPSNTEGIGIVGTEDGFVEDEEDVWEDEEDVWEDEEDVWEDEDTDLDYNMPQSASSNSEGIIDASPKDTDIISFDTPTCKCTGEYREFRARGIEDSIDITFNGKIYKVASRFLSNTQPSGTRVQFRGYNGQLYIGDLSQFQMEDLGVTVTNELTGESIRVDSKYVNGDGREMTEQDKAECIDAYDEEQRKSDALFKEIEAGLNKYLDTSLGKDFDANKSKAYNDKKTDRQINVKPIQDVAYINGEEVKFKSIIEQPDWAFPLQEGTDMSTCAENLDNIRLVITEGLIGYYGGIQRIQSIIVSNDQLIINNVCYRPKLSKEVLQALPFDCKDYIMNGCLAPFFDWYFITELTHLQRLCFDSMDFVMSYPAQDLGVGRDFNPLSLFKRCSGLRYLQIEDDIVTYPFQKDDAQQQESARSMRSTAQFISKWDDGYEKYQNGWCQGTEDFRKFWFNSLSGYATNRGNKGFIRYSIGTVLRAGAFAGSGIFEGVSKLLGWTVHGIGKNLRKAIAVDGNSDDL